MTTIWLVSRSWFIDDRLESVEVVGAFWNEERAESFRIEQLRQAIIDHICRDRYRKHMNEWFKKNPRPGSKVNGNTVFGDLSDWTEKRNTFSDKTADEVISKVKKESESWGLPLSIPPDFYEDFEVISIGVQ